MNATILPPEFENMLNQAKSYFKRSSVKNVEYHQCIILRTADGIEKIYSFACNSVKELIKQSCSMLYQENISTVTHIICMWEDESIDIPSYKFTETLCKISIENKNAKILLKSSPDTCNYIIKKLSDIIG